jgi:allantoin racemase
MRLALIHITEMREEFIAGWLGSVRASFDKVLRPDTEVVLRPIKRGLKGDNVLDFDNPYYALMDKREIIEAFIDADKEGFDAGSVHCFADPGIREARAVVSMPLFGPAEAAMHFACQIGRKFAIVGTNMPGQLDQLSEQVRRHGLEQRLIRNGIRFDEKPFAEVFPRWLANPQLCADSVARVAERCVAEGADVLVLGCAAACMFCSTVGFNKINVGRQEVPIVDSVMVAMKMAEMAVDMKDGTGLPIPSRTRNYVLPAREDWERVRKAFGLPDYCSSHK